MLTTFLILFALYAGLVTADSLCRLASAGRFA